MKNIFLDIISLIEVSKIRQSLRSRTTMANVTLSGARPRDLGMHTLGCGVRAHHAEEITRLWRMPEELPRTTRREDAALLPLQQDLQPVLSLFRLRNKPVCAAP